MRESNLPEKHQDNQEAQGHPPKYGQGNYQVGRNMDGSFGI